MEFKEVDMSKEIWRDIPDYEGLYQISSLGKVRSLDMEIECYPIERKPYTRLRKGKILKLYCDHRGYRFIGLHKDGESEKVLVHRLMAMVFLENPMNYRDVTFKDGDRSNLKIDNLMWTSHTNATIKARRSKV